MQIQTAFSINTRNDRSEIFPRFIVYDIIVILRIEKLEQPEIYLATRVNTTLR